MSVCSRHAARKYLPHAADANRIAVCLAGAGYRAAVFHLGTLRRLNEFALLGRVDTFCSVSGGSIVNGMLAKAWKELRADALGVFVNFDDLVAQPIERLVLQRPNLGSRFWQRLRPSNWEKFRRGEFTAIDLLASYYDRKLYKGAALASLPLAPRFLFAAAEMRVGDRWEFTPESVGNSLLGFTSDHKIKLSEAVVASSAPTLDFPPLSLSFDPSSFEKGQLGPRGAILRRSVALVDGSVVDALGTSAVWNTHGILLVSDAGQPAAVLPHYRDWLGNRLLRALAISSQQAHEVAKRWLITGFVDGSLSGTYVGLPAYHGNYGLNGSVGYPSDVVDEICRLPADMDPFSPEEVMTLTNHGYTLADTALRRYLPDQLFSDAPLSLPYPDLVDRSKVLGAIAHDSGPHAHDRRQAA